MRRGLHIENRKICTDDEYLIDERHLFSIFYVFQKCISIIFNDISSRIPVQGEPL